MWKALGLSGCLLLLLLLLSIGGGNGNPLQCSCLENLRVSTADLCFGGSHHPHCHYQAKFYYSLSHCQPGSAESHLDCLMMFILPPPQTSLIAQLVKNLPAMQKSQVRFLGWEDPMEKEMATHSSILAWRIPWTEKPSRVQSMGSQESDMTY